MNNFGKLSFWDLNIRLAAAGHTDLCIEPGFELIGIWVQGGFSHLTAGGEPPVKKLTFKGSVWNYHHHCFSYRQHAHFSKCYSNSKFLYLFDQVFIHF